MISEGSRDTEDWSNDCIYDYIYFYKTVIVNKILKFGQ